MIPGIQTRLSESIVASASSIVVTTDVARITGATQINTILAPLQGFPMIIFLIPTDGAVTLGAGGNILVGIAMAQNRVVPLVWIPAVGKWYIDNGV